MIFPGLSSSAFIILHLQESPFIIISKGYNLFPTEQYCIEMKIKVRLFGDVANVVGSKHQIELKEGSTITSLTNIIAEKVGLTRQGYLGEFKVGGADLAVMVNGKNIALLDGVKTQLKDGDDVVIMPFVVGG
jgi:MoaD family protein